MPERSGASAIEHDCPQSMTDTFFALPGQTDRVRTRHGSRPGDSYADVVFGYLMSRALKNFEASLESTNILSRFPDEPRIDLHSRGFGDLDAWAMLDG